MVLGAMFCIFSYLQTPKTGRLQISNWQKVTLAAVVLVSFWAVTWARGGRGGAQVFAGETTTLAKIGDSVAIAPVLYFYASGPIAQFSEYLKHPDQDGKDLWGRYTFASIYRFLAKLGFDTYVPYYQNFYNTPEAINVGSYLREIHFDFGPVAILLYPLLLGFVISLLELRGGLYTAILLTFLYVVVALSFDMNFVGSGGWYFPLPIALLIGAVVQVRPSSSHA
jgi:hypothetical protein